MSFYDIHDKQEKPIYKQTQFKIKKQEFETTQLEFNIKQIRVLVSKELSKANAFFDSLANSVIKTESDVSNLVSTNIVDSELNVQNFISPIVLTAFSIILKRSSSVPVRLFVASTTLAASTAFCFPISISNQNEYFKQSYMFSGWLKDQVVSAVESFKDISSGKGI